MTPDTPTPSPAAPGSDAREALYDAVKYALNRAQTDADFGYQAGWGTEVFRRLCLAEAAHLGRPFEEIERERRRTAWRYRPRIEELQERVQQLQNGADAYVED